MDATLVKTENGYALENCAIIAFVSSVRPEHKYFKLSLKNCQDIELGYDLDELATINSRHSEEDYILGFQKALEIIGDKNFSKNDMNTFASYVEAQRGVNVNHRVWIKSGKYLSDFKKIQQNKWDVVVETVRLVNKTRSIGASYFRAEKVIENAIFQFKLDENGCLILKRKP